MKTKPSIPQIFVIVLLLTLRPAPSAVGQVPQGFNYQAIARDAVSGNPITDPVDIKIAILAGDASTIIREEQFLAVDPDEHGLFSLVIGQGAWVSGLADFSDIDWTVTPKYILTKIFFGGGWQNLGPAQLWSVPYAMLSEDTDSKQSLSLSGYDLTISEGNTITLPTGSSLWETDGTNIYRLANKVGIGTSSPIRKFHVVGDAIINNNYFASGGIGLANELTGNRFSWIDFHSDDTYTDYALRIIRYNTGPDAGSSIVHRGLGELNLTTQDAAPINFYTTNSQRMTIRANGNVGIGTNAPNSVLNPYMTIGDALNSTSEIMNLTIKTTTNVDYLRFYGIRKVAGNTWGDVSLRIQHRVDATDMGYIEFNPGTASQDLAFGTGNTERLRIGAAGNVGIGTTSPLYLLDVNGSGRFSNSVLIGNSSGPIYANWWEFGVDNGNGTGIDFHANSSANDFSSRIYREGGNNGNFYIWNTGTGVLQLGPPGAPVNINSSGNVGIGTTSPVGKMSIQPPSSWSDETPLFEVKNRHGIAVLAVYNNGVKINIEYDPDGTKGPKGGFAIGGYDYTKDITPMQTFMNITPDSIRFNINNGTTKGPKGGFAIGGFGTVKGAINEDFMYITPQSSGNGQYNTFLGYKAGNNSSTAIDNVMIGYNAGYNNDSGSQNVFIGKNAGIYNRSGDKNVILGWSDIVAYPFLDPGDLGSKNTLIGYSSGLKVTGDGNTAIGYLAGNSLQAGVQNTLVGDYAGDKVSSGNYNVIIGTQAGENTTSGAENVFVGGAAGWSHTTGSNNIAIGTGAELLSNTGSNQIRMGDTRITYAAIQVAWTVPSDLKWKESVENLAHGLDLIIGLKPVDYIRKNNSSGTREAGFIAQDVQQLFSNMGIKNSGLLSVDADGSLALRYNDFIPILTKAIQEQQEQIEAQKVQIERLSDLLIEMKSEIASLRSQ